MLFKVTKQHEAKIFRGLAGPGSYYYPFVQVEAPCHLFHLYAKIADGDDQEYLSYHFVSTQIGHLFGILSESSKACKIKSPSIYLQRSISEDKEVKMHLLKEIYRAETASQVTHVYITKDDEEIPDFFEPVKVDMITQKQLVYRHGDTSFFD